MEPTISFREDILHFFRPTPWNQPKEPNGADRLHPSQSHLRGGLSKKQKWCVFFIFLFLVEVHMFPLFVGLFAWLVGCLFAWVFGWFVWLLVGWFVCLFFCLFVVGGGD